MAEEKYLEEKLRREAKKRGGICWKWTSPGTTGVPDRIVILPGRKIGFAEVKTTGKTQSPRQLVVARVLARLGFAVTVIDDIEKIVVFLDELQTA